MTSLVNFSRLYIIFWTSYNGLAAGAYDHIHIRIFVFDFGSVTMAQVL